MFLAGESEMATRTRSKRAKGSDTERGRGTRKPEPGDTLRIAVTFPRPDGREGVVHSPTRLGVATVGEYRPSESAREQALEHLERLGFRVTVRGQLSVSVRGSRALFERTFGTELSLARVAPE